MKLYKLVIIILVVFFKTETLFSENSLFNVNNIKLEKKVNVSNKDLANQAIKNGFNQLITKILLKEDKDNLSDLNFSSIKQLVNYYQIENISDQNNIEIVNFSITFDKDKIHRLFFKRGLSYSEVSDKELYFLPILIENDEVYVFNNNFFYENWNRFYENDLIEFILPLENIEILKKVNDNKNDLINIDLFNLFEEFKNKNIALILIEDNKNNNERVYIKSKIQDKDISKALKIKKGNLNKNKLYEKIITETKKELINLVKSKNLIDIRTPSFLKVKLNLNKDSNLVELNSRIKKIDSIESIYVQDFNKDFMNLRIKYLGNLEKIIILLKLENIDLQLINEQWVIKL